MRFPLPEKISFLCCVATSTPLYCTATKLANIQHKERTHGHRSVQQNPEKPIKSYPIPWVKANKLFAENLEKMMKFQMNALKSYLDIGLNQMRAAAEITDMHSFQDFCKRQAQIAQTVQYKMLNDVKALSDMNAGFKVRNGHVQPGYPAGRTFPKQRKPPFHLNHPAQAGRSCFR
jgi:phasin family protein